MPYSGLSVLKSMFFTGRLYQNNKNNLFCCLILIVVTFYVKIKC